MEKKVQIRPIVRGGATGWQAQAPTPRKPANQEASKPVMKTTIDLPDVLVQQARQRALHLGRPFKELVTDDIRQGLSELPVAPTESSSGALEIAPDGLPVFRRDPASSGITPPVEQLLALEQNTLAEEDRLRAGLPD
jgi:hypothetical protein